MQSVRAIHENTFSLENKLCYQVNISIGSSRVYTGPIGPEGDKLASQQWKQALCDINNSNIIQSK